MNEHKEGMTKNKLYALIAGICVLAIAVITVISVAAVATGGGEIAGTSDSAPTSASASDNQSDDNTDVGNIDNPAPVQADFILPVENATVLHNYEFYYNSTLQCYYEHSGIDFAAEKGTPVVAAADGTVVSVTTGDRLLGSQVTIAHENGITTVYTFIDPAENLKAGDKVKQGDTIGTIAEPNGEEYKDGAHLHFEIFANGSLTDPNNYLTLNEK